MRTASPPVGVFSTRPRWPFSLPECHNLNLRGWLAEEWIASWLAGEYVGGGWGSSTGLDCMGGQLVLLTRDQYCPQSGWSQAAGSDRGAVWRNWIRGRSKSPACLHPPSPKYCHSCHMSSPYTAVTPGGRWSPLLPFPSHPCKCPLRRWTLQILDPFFMLLCKGKIYVIWEFHGNKVTIYWKPKEWNRLEGGKKKSGNGSVQLIKNGK